MWKKLYHWFNRQSDAALLRAYAQNSSMEGFGVLSVETPRTIHMNALELNLKPEDGQVVLRSSYKSSEDNAAIQQEPKSLKIPNHQSLLLSPSTADRPLLVQFSDTLVVPPNSSITLESLSPVWVRVGTAQPYIGLLELATRPLQSAWVGKAAGTGRFAYHLPQEQIHINFISPKAFHVQTSVVFENQRKSPVTLSSMLIPHPFLSLYVDGAGDHHTSALRWIFSNAMDPKLQIEKLSSQEGFTLVQGPRTNASTLMVSDFIQLAAQI